MPKERPLLVFSGRANPVLTESICGYLQIEMGSVRLGNFSDGETYCQIEENIRGADVFIVQPTGQRVADGAADHARCIPQGITVASLRCHSLPWICTAGSQGCP